MLAVREDFLGVYEYHYNSRDLYPDEYAINKATIRLYWGVIGLVSEWLGCTVEDLAMVSQRNYHAYTPLGADIEGRRWPASSFTTESGLKEGLAQYIMPPTESCGEWGIATVARSKSMRQCYLGNPSLTVLKNWVKDFSPEAVRRAMLEVRRWQEGKLDDFNRRLGKAQKELQPREER